MRLDLFLKWSRVIPRRGLAHDTCDAGRVAVNGEVARPARSVKVQDVIRIVLPTRNLEFRVRCIPPHAPSKAGASELIEILENLPREDLDS